MPPAFVKESRRVACERIGELRSAAEAAAHEHAKDPPDAQACRRTDQDLRAAVGEIAASLTMAAPIHDFAAIVARWLRDPSDESVALEAVRLFGLGFAHPKLPPPIGRPSWLRAAAPPHRSAEEVERERILAFPDWVWRTLVRWADEARYARGPVAKTARAHLTKLSGALIGETRGRRGAAPVAVHADYLRALHRLTELQVRWEAEDTRSPVRSMDNAARLSAIHRLAAESGVPAKVALPLAELDKKGAWSQDGGMSIREAAELWTATQHRRSRVTVQAILGEPPRLR